MALDVDEAYHFLYLWNKMNNKQRSDFLRQYKEKVKDIIKEELKNGVR
jgi:hypothetical protein